jgi:hypothetical protein
VIFLEEVLVEPDEDIAWYIGFRFITGMSLGIQYVIGDEDDEYSSAIILDLIFIEFSLVFNK